MSASTRLTPFARTILSVRRVARAAASWTIDAVNGPDAAELSHHRRRQFSSVLAAEAPAASVKLMLSRREHRDGLICRWMSSGKDANVNDDETGGEKSPESAEKVVEEEKLVVVEKMEDIHVMTIGINRPNKRNSVNKATAKELIQAFEDFESDESMRCCVFHGVGGNFSSGYDLEELSRIEDDLPNVLAEMLDAGPMGPTRMHFSKPVIAAVSGWAVAGGLELALMCDLRVVEESAKLGFLCRRFGVPLIDGGSVRLPELIGLSRAMDLIITGRIVEAKEAYEMGLANRLVATGSAFGHAVNIAREIVKHPQECLKVDRASAYYATFASKTLEDSLQYESENALNVISKESIAGAKKFVEGLGKHGKFNVSPTIEKQEWEKEYDKMREEFESQKEKNKE